MERPSTLSKAQGAAVLPNSFGTKSHTCSPSLGSYPQSRQLHPTGSQDLVA